MERIDRRRFLTASSALAGGLALGACSDDGARTSSPSGPAAPASTVTGSHTGAAVTSPPTSTAPPAPPASSSTASTAPDRSADFDPTDWASVRSQFGLGDEAQFTAFVLAAHPRPVAEAIARHRDALDRDGERYLERIAAEGHGDPLVQAAAGEYLGTRGDQVALVQSTTMGLGLLYGSLRVRADQRVLTTDHDFFSTHQAWALRQLREGIAVDRVALYTDPAQADAAAIVDALMGAVTPATRVVAVTWVHSGTGVKLPVRAIADALREVNAGRDPEDRALLCVDGIHGFGVEDAGVADLGCDFLVSGTHKWLFGPRGTGIVWGAAGAWEHVEPVVPAFEGESFSEWINSRPVGTTTADRFTPGGTHAYEHRWAAAAAFEFHATVGKRRIAEYTRMQAARLKEGLAAIPGVRLVTPIAPDLSAGIVCVEVEGRSPFDVVEHLAEAGIVAGTTPYRDSFVRFGPSIVTTPGDVDRLLDVLSG